MFLSYCDVRSHVYFPAVHRSLQKPTEAYRSLQKPTEAYRSLQKPTEAYRSLQKPTEARRRETLTRESEQSDNRYHQRTEWNYATCSNCSRSSNCLAKCDSADSNESFSFFFCSGIADSIRCLRYSTLALQLIIS